MNVKLTVVLLAILAGLIVVVLVADRAPEEVRSEGMLFPEFVAADVRSLVFSHGGTETCANRVEGASDRWTVTVAGLEVPADADEIEEVLSEIGRCSVLRRIPAARADAQARADYGLTPEVRKVRVTMRGAILEAVLGLDGIMRDSVYARRTTEDDVLLVDHGLAEAIADRGPDKVRAKRVVEWSVYDTDRFSVEKGGEPPATIFAAERSPGERAVWTASVPYGGFLDPKTLESDLLPAIVELSAAEFSADGVKDEDLPKYGLDKPRFTIMLGKQEGGKVTERRILVGGEVAEKEGMGYVMEAGKPFVYSCAVKTVVEHLSADPAKWRDRNLTRLGWKPVDRVVARFGEVSFEAERQTAEWNLVAPEKMVLDTRAMDDWFAELRDLSADAFIDAPDLAAFGLVEPRGEIALYPPKVKPAEGEPETPAEPVVRVLIGGDRDDGPGVFAKRDGTDTVFRMGPGLLDLVKTGHWRLRKKAVLSVDLGTKDVTAIRRVVDEEDLNLVKVDGAWPAGIRGNAVTGVAKEILDLTAVRWVGKAEGREEEFGLSGAGRLEFRVTLKDRDLADENEYGVIVGGETEGGRFARAIREGKPEPDVFVLSAAALEGLKAQLREPPKAEEPKKPGDTPPVDEPEKPQDPPVDEPPGPGGR